MRTLTTAFACTLLIASVSAWAHHSFAMFDASKTVQLSGTVKEFQWVNPHSWLQILVPDTGGKTVEWSVEMGGPASLYKSGWRQSYVKAGDKISVQIHPLKDGRAGGSLMSATLADGRRLREMAGGPPPPESK
jgi:hypothetical protein